jgi:hypothetical protein
MRRSLRPNARWVILRELYYISFGGGVLTTIFSFIYFLLDFPDNIPLHTLSVGFICFVISFVAKQVYREMNDGEWHG